MADTVHPRPEQVNLSEVKALACSIWTHRGISEDIPLTIMTRMTLTFVLVIAILIIWNC